ncbi:hypothetical protein GCM10027020_13010 [Nocardioides salsibiostraticola]
MYTGYEGQLACQQRADVRKAATERRLVREIRQAKRSESRPTPSVVAWARGLLSHLHLPHPKVVG